MSRDYYQHTTAQKRFLALLPDYRGDRDELWRAANQATEKMSRMIGKHDRDHISPTDIGKLLFRVVLPLKEMMGNEKTDWANADLTRYASELVKADPGFGFGAKGMEEYAVRVEAAYQQARDMGLADDIKSIEAAIGLAKEHLPMHRIIERLMEEHGLELNQEYHELCLARNYKRVVAEIMLEDAEHKLLEWFERMYLRDPAPVDETRLSAQDRELRRLFHELHADFEARRQGDRVIRSMLGR
ncbi:MAG: hypothetical protein KGJ06_04615 [Pseudomonadota bacterium]|nr:hypothetical protein [Pseudomonadota bacterium]